jgi:hypothetical protein
MLQRIYDELVGDSFTEGLIPKVNRHSVELEEHEDKLKKHDGYFTVMIICFSGLIALAALWNDIKQIFQ